MILFFPNKKPSSSASTSRCTYKSWLWAGSARNSSLRISSAEIILLLAM
ncbi:MAG: hypothetical protein IJL25_04890 [Clostridia bacterium]|nr:hypothetical protein [Clostridia bacterium]